MTLSPAVRRRYRVFEDSKAILFTSSVAKVASPIAKVVGGYRFAYREPGAKKIPTMTASIFSGYVGAHSSGISGSVAIERDRMNALYFLNGDVQHAVIDQERKDRVIQKRVRESGLPFVDAEVKKRC